MGIYDRDYYRNDGPSLFDSLMPNGLVCRWLIGINVAVFVLQLLAKTAAEAQARQAGLHSQPIGWVTEWFILNTQEVMRGQVWRLLTYAFLHDPVNLYHILFNMLFLWWFGSEMEQLYGHKEFLAIYLVSAFLGGAAYELWDLARGTASLCLGASGAVTTMLVLCAFHYPRKIIYLFFVLPVPIWLFAIFNVAQDSFALLSHSDLKSKTAVVVHLTGAAFAALYYQWQGSLVGLWQELMFWKRTRPKARLKIFDPAEAEEEEPVAVAANSAPAVMDEHLEAKLDAVLEKIARTGKDSLTEQERRILQQAAEMYKRRRS